MTSFIGRQKRIAGVFTAGASCSFDSDTLSTRDRFDPNCVHDSAGLQYGNQFLNILSSGGDMCTLWDGPSDI